MDTKSEVVARTEVSGLGARGGLPEEVTSRLDLSDKNKLPCSD